MHEPLIAAIIGGIVLAAILGLLANRLKISPLVGYLIAGIVFGPATPGYVADTAIVGQLAEIGVILLMFAVGLHFSLSDLMSVKSIAIPGAIVQIAVATLLGMGLSAMVGWSIIIGLVFGLCLSTASTVVLLRALEERDLIESRRGRIAIGWLIVEDLVMVLTLVLLPAIVKTTGTSINMTDILFEIAKTVGLVIVFIIFMIIVGRRVIPWVLAKSAATGSDELFTLTVLGIAMGIALAAVELFGASFALGAFFAGMALTESELSHRAANNILPLRDAFAVLFFVSVGMLFEPQIIITHPLATIATVAIILFGKSIAAYIIVRLFGHTKRTALTISASLAQIGEFAFILAALASKQLNVLPDDAYSLILAGAIISIVLNPFVFNLVEAYLAKTENIVDKIIDPVAVINQQVPEDIHDHAILVGHGRLGSTIAAQLQERQIPFIVIDSSLSLIEKLRNDDIITVFGNAAKLETLQLAHLDKAKWLIISSPNGYEAGEISSQAREMRPDIEIYVRAFYDDEAEYIAEHGATKVITGENEIAGHILALLNLDPTIIPVTKMEKEREVFQIAKESNLPEGQGSPIE
ncbi:YbaL family putative K(+) efflux transporter [Utexia brackfieldae]|uniref:YbaL family putative K(+) efflux transporter n=1 Tax=Utexia brackfieldae TaxID=3074108 RepID=UPI00370DD22B